MKNSSNNYQVMLYAQAYQNLSDIYKYVSFEIAEPEVAKRLLDRIWIAIDSLSTFPYAHQDRLFGRYAQKGYKQMMVDNYLIVFRIDEENKIVYVVTIQYVGKNI